MSQVIRGKNRSSTSITYNTLQTLALGTTTLTASAANTVVQARCPMPFAYKIIAVSLVPSGAVAGTASFNLVLGPGAYTQGSVPVTDTSQFGYPSVVAQPGQALFAADQPIVMTADQVQTYYPPLFDAIWPSNSELTLRFATNGTAAGAITIRVAIVPVDNNPGQPQSSNMFFVPGPTTL